MLTTKKIAKKYNFKAKILCNRLIKNGYVVKKNANISKNSYTYELTNKGILNGGQYSYNNKIVWNEKKFYNTINLFKLEVLKQYNLSTINHMTHIENLETILEYGLLAHNNPYKKVDISNPKVNNRRTKYEPIYNISIHDYVPFYFNPRNAMLYANQQKFGKDIIILGFSNKIICNNRVVITNANASTNRSSFTNDITQLLDNNFIDFSKVFSKKWLNDSYIKQTMMSEVLVEKYVNSTYISTIYCQAQNIKNYIKNNFNIGNINLIVKPSIFF